MSELVAIPCGMEAMRINASYDAPEYAVVLGPLPQRVLIAQVLVGTADQSAATAQLFASAPELMLACEAAEQCITDYLEIYKRGAAMLVHDEAMKSLRDDALRLVRTALAKARAGTEAAHAK